MKTRLEHVRINVGDLEAAVKWYEDVLGFKVEARWPQENPNYVHFEREGGAVFGLMEGFSSTPGRFNFYVDDVDALWSKLQARDVNAVEELFDTAYGSRKFTITDPDGNELGFVQG
ncbi:VOC family protein [Halobacillus sp. Marseille-P3879]|uniref:VOC family protein n=1 Tax=Halobacillus sp. Marseille-P3879 TaxID=2045014 RepID=UPI000C7B77BC|nr:VOC family protein [Halobacillus sp. Marseille-P3879]